jgi:hypothetical protein
MNTTKSILDALSGMAERKEPIRADLWLEAAMKLNALVQNEVEQKYEIESKLNKLRASYLAEGKTAAFARGMIEATDEWLEYKKLSALIDRAQETIRLAKKYSTLSVELERGMN